MRTAWPNYTQKTKTRNFSHSIVNLCYKRVLVPNRQVFGYFLLTYRGALPFFITDKRIQKDEHLVIRCLPTFLMSLGKTEADVLVAVSRVVRIAVSRAAVPAVVDPTAAAQNTLLASY